MPDIATTNELTSQREFWNANRDSYLVDPAWRDDQTGKLHHPVPEPKANRWVIIREVQDSDDPYELPAPLLIGEFDDAKTAEMLCSLIIHTKNS